MNSEPRPEAALAISAFCAPVLASTLGAFAVRDQSGILLTVFAFVAVVWPMIPLTAWRWTDRLEESVRLRELRVFMIAYGLLLLMTTVFGIAVGWPAGIGAVAVGDAALGLYSWKRVGAARLCLGDLVASVAAVVVAIAIALIIEVSALTLAFLAFYVVSTNLAMRPYLRGFLANSDPWNQYQKRRLDN